jgi:hypothetical protein
MLQLVQGISDMPCIKIEPDMGIYTFSEQRKHNPSSPHISISLDIKYMEAVPNQGLTNVFPSTPYGLSKSPVRITFEAYEYTEMNTNFWDVKLTAGAPPPPSKAPA